MIKTLLSVFWNGEQRRLRALWRLILQGIYYGALLIALFVSLAIVIVILTLAAQRDVLPASLSGSGTMGMLILLVVPLEPLFRAVSVWMAGLFPDRRRFSDFGIHLNLNWWIDFGFGLTLGAVLMGLIFAIEAGAGWVTVTETFRSQLPNLLPEISLPHLPFGVALSFSLFFFIAVGIGEEFFSRGYHLKNLTEGFSFIGPKGAVIIATLVSSVIFGLMHAGNPNANIISTFNLFLAGLFLALGYILTGELAIPIGLHIAWNFFQGNVFGFPVSGTDAGATFIAIEQGGPQLVTGGPFGPEAGLIGIAAMVLGGILTILWVRVRYGRVGIWEKLATPDLRHRGKEATNEEQQITFAENLAA
ncbi:MAG: CPBP family intramembrane glutamic endopeptidase [Anaerolineae bacterium]